MFTKLSNKITDILLGNNTIKQEDREIYCYGVQQGLTLILNILTTIVIAFVCREFWQCLIFMISFILPRRYAGGYHAKTPLRCYIYSNAVIFAALLIIKFFTLGIFICGCLSVISGAIIFFLSPIEAANKPLDDEEKMVYRIRARIILVILLVIQFVLSILNYNTAVMCISLALFLLAALMVMGMINSRVNKFS